MDEHQRRPYGGTPEVVQYIHGGENINGSEPEFEKHFIASVLKCIIIINALLHDLAGIEHSIKFHSPLI